VREGSGLCQRYGESVWQYGRVWKQLRCVGVWGWGLLCEVCLCRHVSPGHTRICASQLLCHTCPNASSLAVCRAVAGAKAGTWTSRLGPSLTTTRTACQMPLRSDARAKMTTAARGRVRIEYIIHPWGPFRCRRFSGSKFF